MSKMEYKTRDGWKTYEIAGGLKGIDDLHSEYLFHGNSQGDESRTNSIEEYKASQGWMSCTDPKMLKATQEEVNAWALRQKEKNKKYIKKLKQSNQYGKQAESISLTLKHYPLYDNSKATHKITSKPLESFRMTMLDFGKIQQPKVIKMGKLKVGPSPQYNNITMEKCPKCHSEEVESNTPLTQYICGSTDYDQRPGTFRQSIECKKIVKKLDAEKVKNYCEEPYHNLTRQCLMTNFGSNADTSKI